MTPVISPWVFYVMYIADNVILVSTIIFFFALIVCAFGIITAAVDSYDLDEFKRKIKLFKVMLPVLLVSAIVASFVPSENTITKMLVAQNVTYERVETVTDTVETVYNDIMNLFDDSGDSNG